MTRRAQHHHKILQFALFVHVLDAVQENYQIVVYLYLSNGLEESNESVSVCYLKILMVLICRELREIVIWLEKQKVLNRFYFA